MLRSVLRSKAFWAFVLPLAVAGAAYAGGADCDHGKVTAAGKGAHCNLSKNVVKTAKMTDDGAVVTLKGKNDEAIGHIKTHLTAHQKGEGCEGCPLTQEGVSTSVEITDDGGTITVSASTPETVKTVQEWANKPVGACCKGAKTDKA
jgi:hypothetical protein